MKTKGLAWAFTLIAAIIMVGMAFWMRGDDASAQEADSSYFSGEKAATLAERNTAFNHALEQYLGLEQDYRPRFGDGKLYYNIGNTYFQLGEYARAILYYEKAQTLMPRADKVTRNLSIAQGKLALPKQTQENAFANVFFFHYYLSLPERLQLFFALAVLVLILASAYIWTHLIWLKRTAIFVGLLSMIFLLSIGYSQYIAPVNAVMVNSSNLRRDAGNQYAKVSDQPIPAGANVQLLGLVNDGKWLKVMTPTGEFGYVSQEDLRLVEP